MKPLKIVNVVDIKPTQLITHFWGALCVMVMVAIAGCSPPGRPQPLPTASTHTQSSQAIEPESLPTLTANQPPDPATQAIVQQYLNELAAQGFDPKKQGIWIQAGETLLAKHQGRVPLPAASIDKVATTLVALKTFGPDHQFLTHISATGPVEAGTLQGDLVIEGGEDPFFVWETAVAVGNQLNELGIRRVSGNLILVGKFYMNFELSPLASGKLLQQGLNAQEWPAEAQTQYNTLPAGTPQPQVTIDGAVQVTTAPPDMLRPLLRHRSFPLAELLKKMNRYSNTAMATMLNEALGGAAIVAQKAAAAAAVPTAEIRVGPGNRISPRAAVAMTLAIEHFLQNHRMTIADVFTIVGTDAGFLQSRSLPALSVLKSGIYDHIAALTGGVPSREQSVIWLAVLSVGTPSETAQTEQEELLERLLQHWGTVSTAPPELQPKASRQAKTSSTEKMTP